MDQATQPTHDNQTAKSLPEQPLIELPIPPSQTFNNRDDLATYLDSFALQHGYSISCGRSHPGTLTFWCRRSGFPAHTNKTDRPVKSVKIGCPFEIIATKTGDDKDSNCWFFAPSCTKHNHQPDPDIKPRNRKPQASKDTKPKKTSITKETNFEINPAQLISTQDLQISTAPQPPLSTTTATTHAAPSNVIPPVIASVPLALNKKISGRLQIICSTINQLSSHSQLEILDTFEQILVSRHPSTHSSLFLLPPHLPTTVSNIPDDSKSPNQPLSFHDILQSIHHPSMCMEPDDTNTNNVDQNTSKVVLQSDLPPRDSITDQPLLTLPTAERLITKTLPELPKSMLTPSPNCLQSNDSNCSANHPLHLNESTNWYNNSNFSHPDIDKNLSAHCNIDLKWSGPPNLESNLAAHPHKNSNLSTPSDLDPNSSSHHNLDPNSSSRPNLDPNSSSHPNLDRPSSSNLDLQRPSSSKHDLDQPSSSRPNLDRPSSSNHDLHSNLTGDCDDLESTQQLQVVQKPAQVTRITRKRLREMQSASTSRPQTRSKARQPPITKR
ncbi:hypothetical protein DFH28DRAFT_1136975 [Melampsora americana]|nr:hypothetical protein DFH28DRAFT_1136975 [Melampsora americana]